MRDGRKEGEDLFCQFRTLLDQMGIQVDFDETMSAEEALGQSVDTPRADARMNGVTALRGSRKPTRRVSFDSVPHIWNGNRYDSKHRYSSSLRSRSQDNAHRPEHQHVKISMANGLTKVPKSWKQNIDSRLQNGDKGSVPPSKSTGQHANIATLHQQPPRSNSDASDEDSETDIEAIDRAIENATEAERARNHLSTVNRNMIVEAQALRIRSVIDIARRFIHQGIRAATQYQQLATIAGNHDLETLTRQAFEQWRSSFAEKKQVAETEKFFALFEARAGKARDIFLLSKAFTHWAQCASEEVMKTSAARRHILRTRYFNAWKDITVVNELKARRRGLRKPFNIWKRRTAKVWYEAKQAKTVYQQNVVTRMYRNWFWYFCEQLAPLRYNSKLKGHFFSQWTGSSQLADAMSGQANTLYRFKLCRKGLGVWQQRLELTQRASAEASNFRTKELLGSELNALQVATRLAAPQNQLMRIRDSRLARSVLHKLTSMATLLLQAGQTDDLRIMRNAWTTWNDNLRCCALTRTIDDRLLLQSIYRWVIAERLALWRRLQHDKLKSIMLRLWNKKTNDLCADLGQARHALLEFKQCRTLAACLKTWSGRTKSEESQESRAARRRTCNLITVALQLWVRKAEHLRQMHKWALDARFYIVCAESIKKWQDATTASKKIKRRDGYLVMRRRIKTRLAQQMLQIWRTSTMTMTNLRSQAVIIDERRLVQFGTKLFDVWHLRTLSIIQNHTSANDVWRERTIQYYLQFLVNRYRELTQASARADDFVAETVDTSAASVLRKLNWKLFQIRRQDETAESLESRNRRKHYRNMIKYWAERTTRRRQQPDNPDFRPSGPPSEADDDDDDRLSIYLDTESRTGLEDLGLNTTERLISAVATPGYLRTPLRRSVKGRTRPAMSTTPVTSHLTPFMNRLLGDDSTIKRTRSVRRNSAQVLRESRFGGFDDIPETSPLS